MEGYSKMKKEYLIKLIEEGHEIEFEYKDKKYSICYGVIDDEEVISFCEFYKESKEVKTIEELLALNYNDFVLEDILDSIDEDKIWVF
jgi:hypothetical protein